jgi:hypothetical protein
MVRLTAAPCVLANEVFASLATLASRDVQCEST